MAHDSFLILVGVMNTSKQGRVNGCILATNGGPGGFQPPYCTGMVISDGKPAYNSTDIDHTGSDAIPA